jgi:hypothetical protein
LCLTSDQTITAGFDSITSLTSPYISRFHYGRPDVEKNNDVGLALKCKILRRVCVDFHSQELYRISQRHREAEGDVANDCALDIRASYQLDGLSEVAKREKL